MITIALTIGISGAFARGLFAKEDEPTYVWSGSGPNGEGITLGDIAHAEDFYGCDGGGAVCATGTNTANPSDIKQIRLPN